MSIWGKLIGGTAGFALGGPLGAILGVAAGHGVDKVSNYKTIDSNNIYNKEEKEKIFATGIISLSAKVAKADGKVTLDEIKKFKKIFEFPEEDEKNISELFNAAKKDIFNYDVIARQLLEAFKNDKKLLVEILNSLFAIAYADGFLHEEEEKIIYAISNIFRFSEKDYDSIKSLYIGKSENNTKNYKTYCKVLGVPENCSLSEVNEKYKKLVKEYHPDRLQGLGLPEEFINLANKKLTAINEAYNFLKNEKNNE